MFLYFVGRVWTKERALRKRDTDYTQITQHVFMTFTLTLTKMTICSAATLNDMITTINLLRSLKIRKF